MTSLPRRRVDLRPPTGGPGSHPARPDVPAVCVPRPGRGTVDLARLGGLDLGGCAVLVHTGWIDDGRTPAPWVTMGTATALLDSGVTLLGIDTPLLDDPEDDRSPVAARLAAAGVLVLTGLGALGQLPRYDFLVSVTDEGAVHASVRAAPVRTTDDVSPPG